MIGNSVNGFFVLLFGATGGGTGECLPYTRPSNLTADLTLSSQLQRVSNLAADDHLCEQLQ